MVRPVPGAPWRVAHSPFWVPHSCACAWVGCATSVLVGRPRPTDRPYYLGATALAATASQPCHKPAAAKRPPLCRRLALRTHFTSARITQLLPRPHNSQSAKASAKPRSQKQLLAKNLSSPLHRGKPHIPFPHSHFRLRFRCDISYARPDILNLRIEEMARHPAGPSSINHKMTPLR